MAELILVAEPQEFPFSNHKTVSAALTHVLGFSKQLSFRHVPLFAPPGAVFLLDSHFHEGFVSPMPGERKTQLDIYPGAVTSPLMCPWVAGRHLHEHPCARVLLSMGKRS